MSQSFESGPESTARAVEAVGTAVAASDYERAGRLAEEAMTAGVIHPALLNARAMWLERQGRDEEALTLYQQARAFTPKNAHLLNAIGLCLTRLHRFDEAFETFDEAVRIAPAHAPTHHRKGLALGLAGRHAEAEAAHLRATQLDPLNAEAIASVAAAAARKGNDRTARFQADRALRLDPANATAHVALALLENANGEFISAEARLKPLFENPQLAGHGRAVAMGLLADALDGQDKTEEAFAAYAATNAEHEKLHAQRFREAARASDVVDRLVRNFEHTAPDEWTTSDQGLQTTLGPKAHVFLLGFPRSGTTLLEQVLESHESVVTLEERDFLTDLAERFLTSEAGLAQMAGLAGPSLDAARETYWYRVREHGLDTTGKVFVDKHPLNTIKLPLIFKLFPGAKILFAVRDPRDVVLSCFRRQLDIDLAKFELLTLDGAARLYDRVMWLGELSRRKLPLVVFEHRYEDLVADFDGRTRAICDFLGLPWSERMRDFSVTAKALGPQQASAGQVQRGLYMEGVGQWRRYERELSPVLPVLQPWIERFGYA